MNEIKVKVGDTVIRYDGLKGKVENFFGIYPVVLFENNTSVWIKEENITDYYLIGHTVIGNKATEEEIESAIKCVDYQIEELKAKKKQLRKQLWRLKEEMVEDWKYRRQARINKKQNQPAEEDTED